MVCILFPLESISMYFSCAQKTRKEDKVTHELKHLVDSFPVKVADQYLVEGESGGALLLFQFHTRVATALQSCLCQHMSPSCGSTWDDFSLRVWPASTSLGLNKELVSFLTGAQEDIITLGLIKCMLIGDAFQTSMSKLTCSWCLLAHVSFECKLFALKGKCLLLYTLWFQPPKPLLKINLNHRTSAWKPKPKSITLMTSITNLMFLKFCCE